jgi:hypothetical protein
MARTGTAEIRINRRTLRIGHEVYPLANISRVQTVQLSYAKTPAQALTGIVVMLLVGAVAAAVVSNAGVTVAQQAATVVLALVGLRLLYLVVVLVRRLLRRPVFCLLVEASGTQFTALSSHDRRVVHEIADLVVGAIENPPSHEIVRHVHNVFNRVEGDQFNQSGSGNAMNVNR